MDCRQQALDHQHGVCVRILQHGHRQGRWCDGVWRAGRLLLEEGTPRDILLWAAQLDELEFEVKRYAGLDKAASA